MSNPQVHIVKFDEHSLPYINEEGSGTPLFVVDSLAKALGIHSGSGYWYKDDLKAFSKKRRLKPGKQKRRMISIEGVFKLLDQRHPLWEQDFRDKFLIFQPEVFSTFHEDKTPNNLPVTAAPGAKKVVAKKVNKLLEQQKKTITILVDTVKKLETQQEVAYLDIPRRAKQKYPGIGTMTVEHYKGKLVDHPVYTHVPGYRSYKEMLDDHDLAEYAGTPRGRTFSRRLAKRLDMKGIKYYLVLDSYKLAKRRNTTPIGELDTNAVINAYPTEAWEVAKPLVLEMLDGSYGK